MSIYVDILTGGANNHETTSEAANHLATDFVEEGVIGVVTNTSGVAPMTGAFAVNAQGTPDMTVAVSAGVAYVTATPTGQASQMLRVYNNASANVTIAANSSGSTKYDWVYISVNATNAAAPNTAGDNVATLVTSRSSSATADDGTPPTYGYPIAVVTVANAASSITNGNITDIRQLATSVQDGSVSADKLASDATGHGYLELKRTTLTVAGDTMTVSSIPARKYLKITVLGLDTGGTIGLRMTFNNDTASNYTLRYSVNNAADTTGAAAASIVLSASTAAQTCYATVDVINIAAVNKLVIGQGVVRNTSGTGSNPDKMELSAKWANTSAQITRIDVTNPGTGDFAIGSEVIVSGRN